MTRFHPPPVSNRSILESSNSIRCETLAYAERLVELGKLTRVRNSSATPTSGAGDRWEWGRNDQESALSIFVLEASRVLGRRGFLDGLSIGWHAT
jgi:hypothetical protein